MESTEEFMIIIGSEKKGNTQLGELLLFLNAFEYTYNRAYLFYLNKNSSIEIARNHIDTFESYNHFHKIAFIDFVNEKNSLINEKQFSKIEPILFDKITTNSPLKFMGYCSAISLLSLSLAASLAGGEVDLKNRTFKVNSLIDSGIKLYRVLKKEDAISREHIVKNLHKL